MKINKILIEKIQSIYEYDEKFFTYNRLEKDMWYEKIKEAKERFKVYFDLENDGPVKSQREITIPQNEWSPTECKFKCEMYSAGGDWEVPVRYFRIQIVSGYCYNDNEIKKGHYYMGRHSSSNSHFVFIPGKKKGNYQLVPSDKNDGKWFAPNNDQYFEKIDPKANERECWKSLEEYLKEMVNKEIEHVQQERAEEERRSQDNPQPSPPSQ